MSTGAREGYSSEDERELNEIKSELVSSAESEDQLLGQFLSVPSSPSRVSRLCPDTAFTLLSARDRISSWEKLAASSAWRDNMTLDSELQPKKASRSAYKGKITQQVNFLNEQRDANALNEMLLERSVKKITAYLDKIEDIETEMSGIWDKHSVPPENADRLADETAANKYQLEITTKLTNFRTALQPAPVVPVAPNDVVSNKELVEAIVKSQGAPGRSFIQCEHFDGGNADAFAYKLWFSQFENMLASGRAMADRFKLSALRNHLTHTGLAFKLISQLEINDDNYKKAIEILDKEFLDSAKIVDKLLDQLLDKSPKFDPEFENLRLYVAEIRSILNDLKNSYDTDLETPETGGYKLVSKIIYAKLPPVVQKALIEKVACNYPTLDHIFDNIKDIIEKLVKTKSKKVDNLKKTDHSKTDSNKNSKSNKFSSNHKPALENFATGIGHGNKVFHCKFCDSDGHSSYYCSQYKIREQRLDRCKVLRLLYMHK